LAKGKTLDPSIAKDKALRSDFAYDETRADLTTNDQLDLDDEYAQLSGLVDPRGEPISLRCWELLDTKTTCSAHHYESRSFKPTCLIL
jgi:hypothetical protein